MNFCPQHNNGLICNAFDTPEGLVFGHSVYERFLDSCQLTEFSDTWRDADDFANDLRESIERANAGLTLSRAKLYIDIGLKQTSQSFYRLTSNANHGKVHFTLLPYGSGLEVFVVAIDIELAHQGRFSNLVDFRDRVFKTLLNGLQRHRIHRLVGRASPNRLPIRGEKDWRREENSQGETKLSLLYKRLGAARIPTLPAGNFVVYSEAGLEILRALHPAEARLYEEQVRQYERKRVIPNGDMLDIF